MTDSFEAICEQIFSDILGLKDRFPHFRSLDRSHIEGRRLQYSHGHREVPNPNFDPDRMHKVRGPYSKTIDEWGENGIRFQLTLEREHIEGETSTEPEPVSEWSDLDLRVFRRDGHSFARIGPVHASFRVQGAAPDPIYKAVLEVLRKNLPPGG